MIKEKDIISAYEGVYRIAETIGSRSYTLDLSLHLDRLLTNRIKDTLEDIKNNQDKEYWKKFEELKSRQRGNSK